MEVVVEHPLNETRKSTREDILGDNLALASRQKDYFIFNVSMSAIPPNIYSSPFGRLSWTKDAHVLSQNPFSIPMCDQAPEVCPQSRSECKIPAANTQSETLETQSLTGNEVGSDSPTLFSFVPALTDVLS